MALFANDGDWPTFSPFSFTNCIPSVISVLRIKGKLMQLAAATAANGTKRPVKNANCVKIPKKQRRVGQALKVNFKFQNLNLFEKK